ncbi:MAG: acetyl-CoA C-acetyltransferase [Clostridia bacterium]|nr:acetyl-CoA C-acetyltransferase [Clostridia bacterium]
MSGAVYLVGGCRTAVGRFGGSLASVPATALGAAAIREAVRRAGLEAAQIEHAEMGCVLQAGLGQNPARQAALLAGMPEDSTAVTVNCVCGSGLESVNRAARLIASGEADLVAAGGMENMSRAPFALPGARFGYRIGNPAAQSELVDTMIRDALWDVYNDCHMGVTAENIAARWQITREEADAFALRSQQRAAAAADAGRFAPEIVPVELKGKKGTVRFDSDEGIRRDTSQEALSRLSPAFQKGGVVTAGNASGLNDGAAAVVLASEEALRRHRLTPLARWGGSAAAGVDPAVMGIGPVASTRKLLKRAGLGIADIDLFEANEAFAVQSIAVQRELGIPEEKLNVRGGAIALGHPVGASGCRILVTLLYAMRDTGARTGLATLCVGGGMGISTLLYAC